MIKLPGKIRLSEKAKTKLKKNLIIGIIVGLIISILILIFTKSILYSIIGFFITLIFFIGLFFAKRILKKSARIRKMEEVFPDFLQLMSSNLRAGITIDKSMLLSAREEFAPLDKEIITTGKEIATGKDIATALKEMSKRIGSDKINKTILLILSGIRSGGNIAILLEQTSVNMRERSFVEKKASSSVTMYVIFIFIAVSIGAPALFALSTILVGTLTQILSGLPAAETTTAMNIPFTLSNVSVSTTFITYFSILFIITTDVLASLVLGLVNKGEEKEGLKYLLPLIAISLTVFFAARIFLSGFLGNLL